MKTIKYIAILFAGLITSSAGLAQQSESLQAVSIVFTSPEATSSIDTLIPSGESSLTSLLQLNGLSKADVHMIRLDQISNMLGDKEHNEIVVIKSEETGDHLSEPKRIHVIQIDGDEKSLEDLTPEQRRMIKEGMSQHSGGHSNGENHFVKRIEFKPDGESAAEGEELEIEIEEVNENGVVKKMVWVNGEESSQEDLDAIMKEHRLKIKTGELNEEEMLFIGDENPGEVKIMRIEHKIESDDDSELKKAIVIVRSEQKVEKAVSAMSLSTGLMLYPNPASDNVQLRFDPAIDGRFSVQITSLDGRVVRQQSGNASKKSLTELDISDLAAGTYIVTVGLEEGLLSSKLIIE